MTIGLQGAAEITDAEQLKATLRKLADQELARYGTSLTLLADLNQAYGLLREALAVDRAELIKYAQDRFKDITASVDKTLQEFEANNPDPNRRNVTMAVLAFGAGDGSVFNLREREFGNRQSIVKNQAALTEAATGLNAEIDRIVMGAQFGGQQCHAVDLVNDIEQQPVAHPDRRSQHPGGCRHRALCRASEDRRPAAAPFGRDAGDRRRAARHHDW